MLKTTSAAGRGMAGACCWAACGVTRQASIAYPGTHDLVNPAPGAVTEGQTQKQSAQSTHRGRRRLPCPAQLPRMSNSPVHGRGTWARPHSAARAAAGAASAHAGRRAGPRPPGSRRLSGCAPRSPRCAAMHSAPALGHRPLVSAGPVKCCFVPLLGVNPLLVKHFQNSDQQAD